MGAQLTPPLDPCSPSDSNVRKRVCKACDRCRLKKSKCDGSNPCGRCKADNAICVFGERKKSHDKVYPKGYVEMLEQQQQQLVTGLQELYRRVQNGQGWTGGALKESGGHPLTHDILERLGALKQDGHATGDPFEEDLQMMQQRLIANGAGFMQREPSSDGSEHAQSPIYDPIQHKAPQFTDPFSLNQFPPTPSQSPFPQLSHLSVPMKSQTYPQPIPGQTAMNPALLHKQAWTHSSLGFEDNMDFIKRFDSPTGFNGMQQFATNQIDMNMDTGMAIRNWAEEDEFQRYFNPTLL